MIDFDFFLTKKWVGEGTITEVGEDSPIEATMEITMGKGPKSYIKEFCMKIFMKDREEVVENYYTFTIHKNNTFHVLISNENWGHVEGSGFIKNTFIGWEIADEAEEFDAYESVRMTGQKEFSFLGEYQEISGMRTKIQGVFTSNEKITT